jgi:tRNA G18 (ribose-2'-O)-methylase SpoU
MERAIPNFLEVMLEFRAPSKIWSAIFHFLSNNHNMRKLTHDEIASKRLAKDSLPQANRIPVVAIVDNVRSLYNVGSIFRTSDGAMIEKLILTGFTPYPPRKEIEKTALGATESIPWEYYRSPLEVVSQYKTRGYKIVCLEQTDSSIPYYSLSQDHFPLCLIIGNEITGVSKALIELCDAAIDIPMFGIKQSLNVGVAYGIALFELCKIWRERNVNA